MSLGHGVLTVLCTGLQPPQVDSNIDCAVQVSNLTVLPALEATTGIPTGISTDFTKPFVSQLKINGKYAFIAVSIFLLYGPAIPHAWRLFGCLIMLVVMQRQAKVQSQGEAGFSCIADRSHAFWVD